MQESTYSTHPLPYRKALTIFLRASAVAITTTTLATLLALTGCASAPVPTEQFAVAQSSIERATAAGAAEHAALEIKTARDKLAAAQRAVEDEEYAKASALAEEASVDAKLAEAKSESAKAKRSVSEIQDNLRSLRNELDRNSQQQKQMQSEPSS